MKVFLFLAGISVLLLPPSSRAASPPWLQPQTLSFEARQSEHLVTQPARTGTLHETVSAMATVSADLSRTVLIRPTGDGKVTDVLVTPGQSVHVGQPLINYTDHSLHVLALQSRQMHAALLSAQAALSEAQVAYQRGESLSGSTVSRGEVKRRQAAVQEARSIVAAREADIGLIEHRLHEEFNSVTERVVKDEDSSLISPVNGVVQSLQTAVAADVMPGQPVATVVDLSTVWIIVRLQVGDVSRLGVGSGVLLRPAGDENAPALHATVSTVDGVADPMTGLLRVVCVVHNPDPSLRPGTMMDATLETTHTASGVIVPAAAIQTVQGHDLVYVQTRTGEFQPNEVRVRLEAAGSVVVEGDLKAGDLVVTDGSFALKSMALVSGLDTD
ncbi:efflux RND transporter periplasmic adaptor subunit [Gluconobacter morbifer]|uniref:Cation efflux protein n=1 Tax=Gluconobacter morbifer G707 TaxID=1088869 RepID=G6XFC5_9PROT|nr:efflux RND transporter periplasmic adaptor subunit [Gluconobacter morbifer]EHH68883.1 cation efflux protein [Gluconobacter morbifer G707]